jgi:hypothetical protein
MSPSLRSVVIIVASLEIISNAELWVVLGFRYIPISSWHPPFPKVNNSSEKPIITADGEMFLLDNLPSNG